MSIDMHTGRTIADNSSGNTQSGNRYRNTSCTGH